jgi:hypothetical protein
MQWTFQLLGNALSMSVLYYSLQIDVLRNFPLEMKGPVGGGGRGGGKSSVLLYCLILSGEEEGRPTVIIF